MDTKNSVLKLSILTLLVVLIIVPLPSCTFCAPDTGLCVLLRDVPPSVLISTAQSVVFEEQGTIIVYHGFGCAESRKSGTEDLLKVEQSLELPSYATNATVFLNGWDLQYLNKDHHVAGLGTLIKNIRLEGSNLKWEAAGLLSDQNFDDAYTWCYHYTVVAWNPSNINLLVDHKDGSCDTKDQSATNFFTARNNGTTTALSSFPRLLQNPDFAASKTVAILPRGFGFSWSPCSSDDHHLLQIGYNLDHSEIFIEKGKRYKRGVGDVSPSLPNNASQVGSGYVSWQTSGIFKDNTGRREYSFGELVSALGGNDVGIIQPNFSILPAEDGGGLFTAEGGVFTEEFVVENIPFEFAVPMLTGWELGYELDDEHVREVGIWIDGWSYEKAQGAPVGTLRYKLSSVLRDKNSKPGHYHHHKITILGLRAVSGKIPSEKVPDLVPFSPSGTDPAAFCRLEQDKMLKVTVKNQGNDNAPASKTTVTFLNKPFTLDTPAIPAGGSVDLLFRVPSGCFTPDCSFKITVDSANQVNESSNEGNNSTNGGCIG